MKNLMNNLNDDCRSAMDIIFGFTDDKEITLLQRLYSRLHIFMCPRCSEELRKLESCREMFHSDFFPSSPGIEEKVMDQLSGEFIQQEISDGEIVEAPGGFSFRTWVMIGLFVLVSIFISFYGLDFFSFANDFGSTFLISLGITTGIILTGYGAFFIASHIKELTNRFNLH